MGMKTRLIAIALAAAAVVPQAGLAVAQGLDAGPGPATIAPDVAAPTAAAPPMAVEADPVTVAIRALLSAPGGLAGVSQRNRTALAAFYRDRADGPAWLTGAALTDTGRAAVARIARAAEDGLDPTAFALPDVAAINGTATPDALAAADVGLSLAVMTFAEQASGGRVAPSKISKDITRTPPTADPLAAVRAVSAAADPAAVLDGFNPPNEGFRRLKAKLAEMRARGEDPAPAPIAEGPSLKPGMRDPRVPALRARLGLPAPDLVTGALPVTQTASASDDELVATVQQALETSGDEVYDDATVAAVKSFQSKAGLTADGIVGTNTLDALNGGVRADESDVIANMEMWRWMPRDLGTDYVFVNVPEFKVRVVRDGVQIHEAKVVVGKPDTATPIFSDEMEYLVVNPYWNVPESIKIKEMLPAIKADPAGYMARHGYEVVWNGEVIDPSMVVWDENAVKAVGIRQVPGEANALGHIKFMFPNQHAVYLHDTPQRQFFQRDRRAYSHGCVRVDDPMSFAAAVLQGDPEWTVERLQSLFGGPEQRVNLAHHLKVHIAYFTAWVDNAGALQTRADVYGHMKKLKAALGVGA